jgi:hypothetical protein
MSLFVSCYKTFVTTLWPPMPQPQQTPYPLQILTLLPSFFTPADLKSKPQTTRNYQNGVGKKRKKKRQYPPQSPKPPLSSSLTTQQTSSHFSHPVPPLFVFFQRSKSHTKSTRKLREKTTKTKVRYKEKKKKKKGCRILHT